MRILHLGNPQVVPALRALGHDVRVASELSPLLVAPGRPVDVRVLHREIAPDAEAFFMVDTLGRQTLAYGVEDLPIPRLYWAIDVHLNFFWQRHYGRLFDLVLTAQQDYVAAFESDGVPARWLPWGIDPRLFHDRGLARTIDVAFVGVVDAHRPKRAAALAELRRRFDVVTLGEDPARRVPEPEMARVFGAAKIVFNESVMGDVNFRTFEAMACGALLLTERTGNGLTDLFTPDEHLAVYGSDDLLAQTARYLGDDAERARVARNGCELVAAHHTMPSRMASVTDWLTAGVRRRDVSGGADAAFGVAAELTVMRGLSDPPATLRLAAERLQKAAVTGREPEAALALADVMIGAGRADGALQLLRLVQQRDAGDPRAWFLAAEVERGRGRTAEATELFRAGIAAAPIPTALRDEALAALAEPDGAPAWFAIGRVLQAVGLVMTPGLIRPDGAYPPGTAMDYFRRAIEREPFAAPILDYVACVLELAGRHEYVRGYRERLMLVAPADPAARWQFAEALRRAYAFTESAHHARVAMILADGSPTGARTELAAAWREAGRAWLHVGDTTRGMLADARATALEAAGGEVAPARDTIAS